MANNFVQEFNRRLGQYTGNLAMPTPDSVNQMNLGARLQNMEQAKAVAKFSDYLQKTQTKSSESKPTTPNAPALGNLSQDSVDLITKAGGNKSFMGVDMPNIWEIPGPVGKFLGPVDEALIGARIQAPLKLGSTAIDLLSRLSYAGFEGNKELYESAKEGQSPLKSIDDVAGGAISGLLGREKTGFGESVEAMSELNPEDGLLGQRLLNPFTGLNRSMGLAQEVEDNGGEDWKTNTILEGGKWLKRTAGFLGEVGLDPMNAVGGKIIGSIVDEAGDVAKYSDAAYRQSAKDAVREGVDQAGWSNQMSRAPRLRDRVVDPVTKVVTTGPQKPKGLDYLDDIVDKALDDVMYQRGGGAGVGKLVGHRESPYAVANNVGIAARAHMTSDFDNEFRYFVDELKSGIKPTTAKINQLRQNVPFFAEFLDEVIAISKKARPNSAASYTDIERVLLDYAKRPSDEFWRHLDQASLNVKGRIDDGAKLIQDNVYNKLLDAAINVPGVRIAGKTIPLNRLGKAYAGRHADRMAKGGGILKDLKYGDTFVGRTPQIAQKTRSLGMKHYEEFKHAVTDMANGRTRVYDAVTHKMKVIKVAEPLTKAERKTIHTNLLKNLPAPPGSRMEEAQAFIKDAYKRLWQEEVDAGLRTGNSIQADNYAYNYYRGSDIKGRIKDFRADAKKTLKKTGSLDPNLVENAKAIHLKPEEDAFRALLYRKLDSNRKLTKSWFQKDLLDNYGMMGNQLSDNLITQMNLVKQFKHGELPPDLERKLGMTKPGDAWYLPKQMDEIFKAFKELGGGNPEHLQGFLRMFDTWTRYFKTATTIPWPGFHIRNSIGDIYMSWIDGVRGSDITYLKNWDLAARKNPGAIRNIAGRNFTFEEMRTIFRENASSGGHQNIELISDVGQTGLGQGARDLAKDPRGIGNLARRASGAREDAFRFNHFIHAMREELPKATSEVRNPERALKRAIDASTERVNRYMFDYAALTTVEQKYLKRIIPFYTYTRKVMPTLIESMFLHPSQFAKTQRLALDSNDGSYNDMLTPQYQRDIGYARLSDEEDSSDPWILGGQFLPTDVLNRNTNFGNFKEFAQNFSAQTNPFMKALYERGGGRQYFNDQPIEGTGQYLADSLVPPLRPLADVPNFPGTDVGLGTLVSKLPFVNESSKKGSAEKLLSGRLGLGLPFDKVNEGQQSAAAYGILDDIKQKFDSINGDVDEGTGLEGAGYHLYVSFRKDGSTFRIKNTDTGDVVFETTDPNKAMEKAKSLLK